jgi:succinyl-CoA synthetase beta subunit
MYLKLMVAEALDIQRETYLALLLDRSYDGPVMIGSPVGGVDIEEVIFISQNLASLYILF